MFSKNTNNRILDASDIKYKYHQILIHHNFVTHLKLRQTMYGLAHRNWQQEESDLRKTMGTQWVGYYSTLSHSHVCKKSSYPSLDPRG